MATVALDWDDTLVEVKTQEWFPDALAAVRKILSRGHKVVIYTCRANWPEGLEQVKRGLLEAGLLSVRIWTEPGKPHAQVYADNQSFPPFGSDWDGLLALLDAVAPQRRPPMSRRLPATWH